MTAVVNINNLQETNTGSIEAISTIARLDHILHKSNKTVLVFDELSAHYSSVGSHYLGSLSDHYNAAYISISAKFNNIQIRCRIIEQLFPSVLFDPEQSLAVSLLRLSKETNQPISIVIEHAQNLNFQLLQELSHLADISKKAKQTINIVLLGNSETVRKIIKEKASFNQKITIISAKTGKNLSFDDQMFNRTRDKFVFKNFKKVMLMIFLTLVILSLSLVTFQKRDVFSFNILSQLDKSQYSMPVRTTTPLFSSKNIDTSKPLLKSKRIKKSILLNSVVDQATTAEIYQVLVDPNLKNRIKITAKATPQDIFSAITEQTVKKSELNKVDDSQYYLQAKTGYVIQFAGFAEKNKIVSNNELFKKIPHKIYYRLLNHKKNVVITSLIFPSKDKAISVLNSLSISIRQLNPWIKSLARVKQEINHYKT